MRPKHKFFAIGIILVVLIVFCATQLQAQEEKEEVSLEEFLNRLWEDVRGLQDAVKTIAEVAVEKSEVRELETRVVALETAMPWPTATPTVTPTPTPYPDESRSLAHQLAIDDHAGPWSDLSEMSADEQTRIVDAYQDFFVRTSDVCELDFVETYELIQKYAEPIDWYSPPHLERSLRNMGIPLGGWRFAFIARIATNSIIQSMIRDHGGCDSYLEWYTIG